MENMLSLTKFVNRICHYQMLLLHASTDIIFFRSEQLIMLVIMSEYLIYFITIEF